MISDQEYIISSLQLHLFFARIMKEHAIFLEASFTPANMDLAKRADTFKEQFEYLLDYTVQVSNGLIPQNILQSGEIITDYTLGIEQKTEKFTDIRINQEITKKEAKLYYNRAAKPHPTLLPYVKELNRFAKIFIDHFITYKKEILGLVSSCTIFMNFYQLNIEHVIHEAEYYRDTLKEIENRDDPNDMTPLQVEKFWNHILEQHALFVRGLLDPTEVKLFTTANDFAKAFAQLQEKLKNITPETLTEINKNALQEAENFMKFNEAGVKGSAECKIRSIILPLVQDHNLREANYYIRLLKDLKV